jgi:hypothetical protein
LWPFYAVALKCRQGRKTMNLLTHLILHLKANHLPFPHKEYSLILPKVSQSI